MKTITEIYKSRGNWRWRMRDRNRKIIGASTEGYKRLKDCRANLKRVSRSKVVFMDGVKPGLFACTLL